MTSNGHPTFAAGRVFVGSPGGKIYSLDAATGCIHRYLDVEGQVRAAIDIAKIQTTTGSPYVAFFADASAHVCAVDAATGRPLWETRSTAFP